MIGQTISHYKILEKLGGGGMGVVYKAEDTKLKRIVALKFLPPDLTADSSARERFAHEAQAASLLDHPNICSIHDISESDDGQTFIVMSFYEGETLKKKLTRGRLKVEQALDIAAQIAEGLAKAHEHGIIHRDLKPANVMITNDGVVKVLDFGLAKLAGETRLTRSGATVGTPAFMSPEQVVGQVIDTRTDIWSLGVVLYEMLSGVGPFRGEHEGALLYEIMSADPTPISQLVPEVEPELEQLIGRCLEKDRDERYQAIKDVAVDCRRMKREMKTMRQMSASYIRSGRGESPSVARRYAFLKPSAARRQRIWMAIAAILFCSTIYFVLREFFGRPPEEEAVIASILPPENRTFRSVGAQAGPIALSPDGKLMVFVVSEKDGRSMLWIRRIAESKSNPLPETEGASFPFWSADGRSVGFFAGAKLKRVDLEGGTAKPREICNASGGLGGSWNREGTIIFTRSKQGPVYRVNAAEGEPIPVTGLDPTKNEIYHQYPYFLPDGNHFLFLARNNLTNQVADIDTIYVASLDDSTRSKPVMAGTTNVAYSSGYLIYQWSGELKAVAFDLQNFATRGQPVKLAESVRINDVTGGGVFTVSAGDLLAYQEGPTEKGNRLFVLDRDGKVLETIGNKGDFTDVRFSPDGKKVAYVAVSPATGGNIWVYDWLNPARPRRITFNAATDRFPVWSPDGKEIVFSSDRRRKARTDAFGDIYRKAVGGGAAESAVHISADVKQPSDWSRDGRYIVYISTITHPATQSDIYVLQLTGEGRHKPSPYISTQANEYDGRLSPDGKWIAYTSNESGPDEIYVSRFLTSSTEPIPISRLGTSPGGTRARWTSGGKEILYIDLENRFHAVKLGEKEKRLVVLENKVLFQTYPTTYAGGYDVSADGTRIVIITASENVIPPPVNLVVGWTALTRKK